MSMGTCPGWTISTRVQNKKPLKHGGTAEAEEEEIAKIAGIAKIENPTTGVANR